MNVLINVSERRLHLNNANFYVKNHGSVNTNGWMDELGFYVPSTVFQSFRDDGRVNMKGSVQ